jgi:hypothetical protein
MQAWAEGNSHCEQIPSEAEYFHRLALALELHEIDEATVRRQRTEWLVDLARMQHWLHGGGTREEAAIVIPPGLRPVR